MCKHIAQCVAHTRKLRQGNYFTTKMVSVLWKYLLKGRLKVKYLYLNFNSLTGFSSYIGIC